MLRHSLVVMGEDPLNLNDVFDVLSVERRRVSLSVLSGQETSLTLPDLAEEVAVRENGTTLPEISAEEVKSIYLDLYHTHIPKLVEIGAIDYHQEADMVTPTENVAHLISILHVVDENDPAPDMDRCTG